MVMEVKSSYTLEVIKDKHNKYVFCVIKVSEQGLKYYLGQDKPHFTRRWLKKRHWMAFDSKLQELAAENAFKELKQTINFQLTGSVFLEISKSTIPIDLLCRTITDLQITPADVVAAIDCKFEYVEKNHVTACKNELPHSQESVHKQKHHKESKTPQKKQLHHSPENLRKAKSHNELKTSQMEQLHESPEDQSKQKHLKEKSTPRKEKLDYNQQNLQKEKSQEIRNKTPQKEMFQGTVVDKKRRLEYQKHNISTKKEDNLEIEKNPFLSSTKSEELDTLNKPIKCKRQQGSSESKNGRVKEKNYLSSSSESDEELKIIRRKKKQIKLTQSANEAHKDKIEKMDKLTKSTHFNEHPSVALHFQEEKATENIQTPINSTLETSKILNQKQKTLTPLPVSKGSYASCKKIPKKKRSRLNTPDSKENRKMTDCFTKIIPFETQETTKTELSSESEKMNSLFGSPSKENVFSSSQNSLQEEIENNIKPSKERTNNNREVTKLLKELTPKSPKKVEVLDLMNLTSREILKTFEKYQQQLENLFIENKSKPKRKRNNNNGVDHFLVMSLLSNTTQLEMMNKLSEHYDQNVGGFPKYGELFSMVLMPEWILGIFMKQYNMTREAAIKYIKAQNAYKMYSQSQIDETMLL